MSARQIKFQGSVDLETPVSLCLRKASIQPSKQRRRLLFFNEIPSWQRDNEDLLFGYRPTLGSIWICLASLAYLHNQTVNIYSHLIGAVLFTLLPYHVYWTEFPTNPGVWIGDLVVLAIYCFGVGICFMFSAVFHSLCNHSCAVSRLCNKLDHLGVLVLMWGANIPSIYYGFPCDEGLRLLYWTMTSLTALICMYLSLSARFGSPQFRLWRATFYAGFGLSSILYVLHGLNLYGWEVQKGRMSLIRMGWMAVANLVGAGIYVARIPERWAPLTFDILGASHQIFHVAVVIAAWLHFLGVLDSFRVSRQVDNLCGVR